MRNRTTDLYIKNSAGFARPILRHLRSLVHTACPAVGETVKWGFPHFEYHGILCSMAAFTHHCAFGFWKASIIPDPLKILAIGKKTGMGHLGRIRSLADLPSDRVLLAYLREAARLNAEGVTVPRKARPGSRPAPTTPRFLSVALRKHPRAMATYAKLGNSHRREYIEWLLEAKREETRTRRLAQTIAWLAEGKSRNWKSARS